MSIQLGIRLHDVNTDLGDSEKTMEARAKKAASEGFSCVHLALGKVLKGFSPAERNMTEGLAMHVKHVFEKENLDIAVLGCYLNLAHPDPGKLADIQSRYYAHMRVAALCGAGVVGTETGAPNAEYKLDGNTHSEEALMTFIRNLEPVVERAESYGVSVAIEPVWNHIVYNPDRALRVIKEIQSRNLRIIFDPVNLLCMENADRKEEVFEEAMDKLGDYIAVVHLKDFARKDGKLISIAAGTGEMDYRKILHWLKQEKPYIQATLENTVNANAVSSREYLQRIYTEE